MSPQKVLFFSLIPIQATMLISLPVLQKDLSTQETQSSSQLLTMYHKQQQQLQKTGHLPVPVIASKRLTRSITSRRLPPLSPRVPEKNQEALREVNSSPSILHLAKPLLGGRTQSEAQLHFDRQHDFEVSLEQMLVEVEKNWGENWRKKKEERQKKDTKSPGGQNDEKLPPVWQKVWYKRIG